MFYLVIILYTLIIFPINLSINTNLNSNIKKLYFNIILYKVITLKKGFFYFENKKINIKIGKKNKTLTSKTIFDMKNDKSIKDFIIYKIDVSFKLFSTSIKMVFISIFQAIINMFMSVIKYQKPSIIIKNNIEFDYKKEDNIYFNLNVFINFLSIIGFLITKMIYRISKGKENGRK